MNETVHSERRLTAADLHRETGLSKAYISKLKKQGKLQFDTDPDGRERIEYSDALKQLEGTVDFNRGPQRQWAEKQRQGRKLSLPEAPEEVQNTPPPADPHGLPNGNTLAHMTESGKIFNVKYGKLDCGDKQIGAETQRSKLYRETWEAQIKEMEFREKCGELVQVKSIEEANRKIAGSIRSKFLSLGVKLAAKCEGKSASEIQYLVEDEVNTIFQDLYQLGGGVEN